MTTEPMTTAPGPTPSRRRRFGKWCAASGLMVGLLAASLSLHADDTRPTRWDKTFRGILLAGVTEGGDKLGYVDVDTGFGGQERTNLKAGGQFLMGIGAAYGPADRAFSLQTTVSLHSDAVSAGSDRAAFDRFLIDVLGFYALGQHRLGVGASLAVNPELDMQDANGDVVTFDNATGVLVQYDYRWRNLGFGIRYVDIEYEVDTVNGVPGAAGDTLDGSHVGLMLTIPF